MIVVWFLRVQLYVIKKTSIDDLLELILLDEKEDPTKLPLWLLDPSRVISPLIIKLEMVGLQMFTRYQLALVNCPQS